MDKFDPEAAKKEVARSKLLRKITRREDKAKLGATNKSQTSALSGSMVIE